MKLFRVTDKDGKEILEGSMFSNRQVTFRFLDNGSEIRVYTLDEFRAVYLAPELERQIDWIFG